MFVLVRIVVSTYIGRFSIGIYLYLFSFLLVLRKQHTVHLLYYWISVVLNDIEGGIVIFALHCIEDYTSATNIIS